MANSRFAYVIYIRTTPEKLWRALIEPEFTRNSGARPGRTVSGPRCLVENHAADGVLADSGEVLEIDPPRKLVLLWRNNFARS